MPRWTGWVALAVTLAGLWPLEGWLGLRYLAQGVAQDYAGRDLVVTAGAGALLAAGVVTARRLLRGRRPGPYALALPLVVAALGYEVWLHLRPDAELGQFIVFAGTYEPPSVAEDVLRLLAAGACGAVAVLAPAPLLRRLRPARGPAPG